MITKIDDFFFRQLVTDIKFNMTEFHLKVASCVDRILLFSDELKGEMHCVNPEEGDDVPIEKIYNGTVDVDSVTAVLLCYELGESWLEAKNVFSQPIKMKPAHVEDDSTRNTIVVNYFNPDVSEDHVTDTTLAVAKFCIVDIPEKLQLGLGIQPILILQSAVLPENISIEDMVRRGFNPKADGYFATTIQHLWPKENAEAYNEEKIKITLYAHSVVKKIDIAEL